MNDVVISCKDLGKKYFLNREVQKTVKSSIIDLIKGRHKNIQDFWALRHVNLEVKKGETLGIIGANGAGKSTLLGVLSKTIRPTEGQIEIQGTLSSLLELGAGFHPDLTGRENIFLYGSILGLSHEEIEKRCDSIIAFSELKDFIDVPVRFYSSGMYVRLGFSVAVEVSPDILIIDEVLAVGDETFRKKCMNKFKEFQAAKKTLLIVSHDLDTMKAVCDRIMVLDKGQVMALSDSQSAVDKYIEFELDKHKEDLLEKNYGNKLIEFVDIKLLGGKGSYENSFETRGKMTVEMHFYAKSKVEKPVFGFSILDSAGMIYFGSNTQIQNVNIPYVSGKGSIQLTFDPVYLPKGKFYLSVSSHSFDHTVDYHRKDNFCHFWMENPRKEIGFTDIPHQWEVKNREN